MKYSIYRSDTRKCNYSVRVKSFDFFSDAKYTFDTVVEKFLKTSYKGRIITKSIKTFKYELKSGDILELNIITED